MIEAPRPLTLIAAVAANNVIGDGTSMTWTLPLELASFKRSTAGGVLIMGRRTYDGLPRRLPGRHVVLLTSDERQTTADLTIARSAEEAITAALDMGRPAFVAGGAAVYAAALPFVDKLRVTRLDFAAPGTTRFPTIDDAEWSEAVVVEGAVEAGMSWTVEVRHRLQPARRPTTQEKRRLTAP